MREKINNWIETYTEEMLSWTTYKVSNPEHAKDIVQDTFFAIVKNINSFQHKSNPKTWIFSILNNKIVDYFRKKYKTPVKSDVDVYTNFFNKDGEWISDKKPKDWLEDETELLDDFDFNKIFNYCIDNLPEKWNALVRMKYLMNKKSEEVCQELEISTTNMWQMMHRAKLKLRSCLEINWFKKDN